MDRCHKFAMAVSCYVQIPDTVCRAMPRLLKALGQHHLIHGGLCAPLVGFLQPAGSPVLEIGPGGGVLTEVLLESGAETWAWELDPAWAFELRRRLGAAVPVVIGDALALPWEFLPEGTLIAGNLPYQVSTAIIQRVIEQHHRVPRAAFLVQREVAERLAASPGSRDYGALSILVQARAEVRILGYLKPGSFRPPPKVDSAFVGLTLQAPPLPDEEMVELVRLVRFAFGQRRKVLRNSLAAGLGKPLAAAVTADLPPKVRAEELALADFLEIYQAVRREQGLPSPPPNRGKLGRPFTEA